MYVNPKSLYKIQRVLYHGVTGSPQWLCRALTVSNHQIGPHFVLSVTLLSTPKAKCKSNKSLSSCAVFSDATINWRETEIPSGLHRLLVPKSPFGLHVNQKPQLATWIITKHRDVQHGLYRDLNGQLQYVTNCTQLVAARTADLSSGTQQPAAPHFVYSFGY